MQDRQSEAMAVYKESLKCSPNNADVLCQIGLLHLRQGEPTKKAKIAVPPLKWGIGAIIGRTVGVKSVKHETYAGDNAAALSALQQANAINAEHAKATLALGSVLQDSLDLDGALLKYRIAAAVQPNIPQVCERLNFTP